MSGQGLTTVYRKEVLECRVSTTDKVLQEKVGLPGMSQWKATDPQVRSRALRNDNALDNSHA